MVTQCNHIFCKDCIASWVDLHKHCPSCRASLTHEQLFKIQALQKISEGLHASFENRKSKDIRHEKIMDGSAAKEAPGYLCFLGGFYCGIMMIPMLAITFGVGTLYYKLIIPQMFGYFPA